MHWTTVWGYELLGSMFLITFDDLMKWGTWQLQTSTNSNIHFLTRTELSGNVALILMTRKVSLRHQWRWVRTSHLSSSVNSFLWLTHSSDTLKYNAYDSSVDLPYWKSNKNSRDRKRRCTGQKYDDTIWWNQLFWELLTILWSKKLHKSRQALTGMTTSTRTLNFWIMTLE